MADTFDCPEHGTHRLCLACVHVREATTDAFLPVGDLDLPVALCLDCDLACDSEWHELPADDLDALCEACYWRRAGLLDVQADPLLEGNLKALAMREMGRRSEALAEELGGVAYPRWRWVDPDTLELRDGRDVPAWHLACDHLGAWSAARQGFLWAFANPSVPGRPRARAWQLRGLGERLGLSFLQQGELEDTTLSTAWILANIAAVLVGARAVRRLDLGEVQLFLAVQDAWRPEGVEPPPPAWTPGTDPTRVAFRGEE